MKLTLVVVVAWFAVPQDRKQDPAQAHAKVPQDRVDKAIQRGVEFLRGQKLGTTKHGGRDILWDELVLWTYTHAGMAEDDPTFTALFKSMMERELEHTYEVSLQAMILEELDRVTYQDRIAQCAQFLVDNQCKNGQWSYGEASPFVKDVPTGGEGGKRRDVASGGGTKRTGSTTTSIREKPPVIKKIPIKKRRDGPLRGDNSNSQYAALGLRACADAGIQLPNAVLNLGAQWWRDSQHPEKEKDGYPAEGWCYGPKDHGHAAYGSMTAGAVGSLVIYDYLLKDNWKSDKDVAAGIQWIAKNFTVTGNPGPCEHGGGKPEVWFYYWLYALERAGILYGTETFGGHEWYPVGATWLLDNQLKDGAWGAGGTNKVWDTCFAILFLRRATRPLEEVASGKPSK